MPAPFSRVVIGPPAHPATVKAASPKAAIHSDVLFFILPPIFFVACSFRMERSRATHVPCGRAVQLVEFAARWSSGALERRVNITRQ
jgi:hypothetical protein